MTDIGKNFREVRETLDEKVILIAVTKTHSYLEINEAIDSGVTNIGENKVQEVIEKYDKVKPVKWHFIGHLQTNKVKYIIDKVDLIHSVDTMKLAKEIDKRAKQVRRAMDVLIQVNAAGEESKFGVTSGECEGLIREILEHCENIVIRGIMFVAPFAEDCEDVRPYFTKAKKQYEALGEISHPNLRFSYLSMGMSHDYRVAVEEGSNMVRIGSAIFGHRVYT